MQISILNMPFTKNQSGQKILGELYCLFVTVYLRKIETERIGRELYGTY